MSYDQKHQPEPWPTWDQLWAAGGASLNDWIVWRDAILEDKAKRERLLPRRAEVLP